MLSLPWRRIVLWEAPALLESIYEEALVHELSSRGVAVQRQVMLPVNYKGNTLGSSLRIDLLVGDLVIVESKATNQYHPVFEAQLLTYLRVSRLKLGLVINFGEVLIKNGIHRVINGL
ncbi:GxxExxY protein [Thiovibrio sp. JS02]